MFFYCVWFVKKCFIDDGVMIKLFLFYFLRKNKICLKMNNVLKFNNWVYS